MRIAAIGERYRRALLTSGASLLPRMVSMLTMIVTIPLALDSLGVERFGIWTTVVSMSWLLSFADFGIGNGVMTSVARLTGGKQTDELDAHVSSALALLLAVSAVVIVVTVVAVPLFNWSSIFRIKNSSGNNEILLSVMIWACCTALNIPASLVQKIQTGLQEGFYGHIWQAIGNFMALIAVVVAAKLSAGLPWFVLATVGSPLLASVFNNAHFFARKNRSIRFRRSKVQSRLMLEFLRIGGQFAILQLAAGALVSSDSFVIATVLGADAVAEYALPERLFAIQGLLMYSIVIQLWPAYAEAIAAGDAVWVKKTLKGSLRLVIAIAVPTALGLVIFCNPILSAWTGKSMNVSMLLLAGFAVWKVLDGIGSACSAFLNGAGVMGPQVRIALVLIPFSLISKIILVNMIGVPGVVWGTVVTYLLISLGPSILIMRREMVRIQLSIA